MENALIFKQILPTNSHHLVLFDVLATSLSQTRCNVIRTYDIIDRLNGDPQWKSKVRVCVRYNFPQ